MSSRVLLLVALACVWQVSEQFTCTAVGPGYTIECSCYYDFKFGREPGTSVNCRGRGLKYFPSGFPSNTTILDLGMNSIYDIREYHTTQYQMLEVLILSDNNLETFHTSGVQEHENLTVLYVENNPALMELPVLPDALLDLNIGNTGYVNKHKDDLDLHPYKNLEVPDSLEWLTIKNSGLTKLPTHLPTALTHLRLSNNSLTEVGNLLDQDFLKELILDDNLITELTGNPEISPLVETLSFQRNKITSVGPKYFNIFSYLTELNLSNNPLSYISPQAFQGLDVLASTDTRILLQFMNNPYLTTIAEEVFDPFLYSNKQYETLTIDLTGSAIDCTCDMDWIPKVVAASQKNSPYSVQELSIIGTCHSPSSLSGRKLNSLTVDEIPCSPTETPSGGGGSSDSNPAAIVLGLLLALSVIGIVGYFVYTKFAAGAQAANTYEAIPEAGGQAQPKQSVNMAGLKGDGYQDN